MVPDQHVPHPGPADALGGAWVRPVPGRYRTVDVGIAVVLLVSIAATVPLWTVQAGPVSAPAWFTAVWALSITAPLALRRRFPAVVAALVAAVYVAGQVAGVPEQLFGQVAVVIALYTVSAWSADHRRSRVVQVVLGFEVALWIAIALAFNVEPDAAASPAFTAMLTLSVLETVLVLGGTVVLGETSWRAAHRLAALNARTAQLTELRERSARQAVGLERMRIARDLHDVVAHHVSVMGLQAGAGRRVLRNAPERAEAALESIEENAREAVAELHGMLRSLRTDDPGEGPPPSTLGLAALPDLVQAATDAGTTVSLVTDGDLERPSPVVGMTVYRVVQEALTNVRKHAGAGATASVRVLVGKEAMTVEVRDRAPGSASPPSAAATDGLGLTGMQERLEAVGGTLATGRMPNGFLVRAEVPIARGAR